MNDYVIMPKIDYVAATDAIRSKTGKTDPIKSGELQTEIEGLALPAPEIKLQEKTITENGEYTADDGFDALGKVLVEVAGASAKISYGTFVGNGADVTVEHGLGVKPSLVIYYKTQKTVNTSKKHMECGITFGEELGATVGVPKAGLYVISSKYSSVPQYSDLAVGSDGGGNMACPRTKWNENTVTFAQTVYPTEQGLTYYWLAIGGLT